MALLTSYLLEGLLFRGRRVFRALTRLAVSRSSLASRGLDQGRCLGASGVLDGLLYGCFGVKDRSRLAARLDRGSTRRTPIVCPMDR